MCKAVLCMSYFKTAGDCQHDGTWLAKGNQQADHLKSEFQYHFYSNVYLNDYMPVMFTYFILFNTQNNL